MGLWSDIVRRGITGEERMEVKAEELLKPGIHNSRDLKIQENTNLADLESKI